MINTAHGPPQEEKLEGSEQKLGGPDPPDAPSCCDLDIGVDLL